jgi:hypothetical protein
MSTNDTSYGVAATSERELTIDKLDAVSGAIDTFFLALLRPAALSQGDGRRGLTGAAGRNEAHPPCPACRALGGSNQAAAPHLCGRRPFRNAPYGTLTESP